MDPTMDDTTFRPSSILIFGATGQIGRYITEAILTANPPFGSVAAFTSPTTASSKAELLAGWAEKGLRVIQGDVQAGPEVLKAYEGVDTVISCLGRNVLLHQVELLRWADSSPSVKWFFPSEYGTDIEYCDKSRDERPHQMKLAVRKFVAEEVKAFQVTYLVTGPYADMFFHLKEGVEDAGGFDARRQKAVVIGDSMPVGFTTMPELVFSAFYSPFSSVSHYTDAGIFAHGWKCQKFSSCQFSWGTKKGRLHIVIFTQEPPPHFLPNCPAAVPSTQHLVLISPPPTRIVFLSSIRPPVLTYPHHSVGKGVVAALRHPEACPDRKAIKMQSFVVTPREILGAFEDLTAGAWAHVRYSTLDQVRELERRLWKEGSPDATVVTLKRIWAEGGTLYEKTDNEAIGLGEKDMESLKDVVGRAVKGG